MMLQSAKVPKSIKNPTDCYVLFVEMVYLLTCVDDSEELSKQSI